MSSTTTAPNTGQVLGQEGELLTAYLGHVHRMGLSDRARRDRERTARAFLAAHPDLQAWMDHPAATRRAELRGSGAWPLLVFAIGTGRVRLDLEPAAVGGEGQDLVVAQGGHRYLLVGRERRTLSRTGGRVESAS